MSVVLVGIGADSNNTSNCPPIYEDGRFEYIPIPEEYESIESSTFANSRLRFRDGRFADCFDHVNLNGHRTDEFSTVQIHHDPNFQALTFGDPGKSRSALVDLESEDLLAFYTGLSPVDKATPKHRYLIGYFVVHQVVDFDQIDPNERDCIARQYRENAHIKRYLVKNDPKHLSNLAIVEGRKPGGLLERGIKLSGGRSEAPGYYLQDEFVNEWRPSTTYLGGRKPVLRIDLDSDDFLQSLPSGNPIVSSS